MLLNYENAHFSNVSTINCAIEFVVLCLPCMVLLICCLFAFYFLGPGPVENLSLVRINETTFCISFTTPTNPNGLINEYWIVVANTMSRPTNSTKTISHIEGVDKYFIYATGLGNNFNLLVFAMESLTVSG